MVDKYWLPARDFEGYGSEPNTELWPGGNKIAVSFVLNYEESVVPSLRLDTPYAHRGAESTPWNGDDGSCDFLHELHYDRKATSGGQRDCIVEDMASNLGEDST